MVTTYAHYPGIGMIAQTSPNGVTSYFEYDEFNRLKYVKDDQRNILKKFEYNYNESAGTITIPKGWENYH